MKTGDEITSGKQTLEREAKPFPKLQMWADLFEMSRLSHSHRQMFCCRYCDTWHRWPIKLIFTQKQHVSIRGLKHLQAAAHGPYVVKVTAFLSTPLRTRQWVYFWKKAWYRVHGFVRRVLFVFLALSFSEMIIEEMTRVRWSHARSNDKNISVFQTRSCRGIPSSVRRLSDCCKRVIFPFTMALITLPWLIWFEREAFWFVC